MVKQILSFWVTNILLIPNYVSAIQIILHFITNILAVCRLPPLAAKYLIIIIIFKYASTIFISFHF